MCETEKVKAAARRNTFLAQAKLAVGSQGALPLLQLAQFCWERKFE
jgi:hypothetical protein